MIKYRTESFSGQGVRDAIEVMSYEVYELGNSDILLTLCNGLLKNDPLGDEIRTLADSMGTSKDLSYDSSYVKDLFGRILPRIKEITGYDIKYALWLADYQAMMKTFWPWANGIYDGSPCPEPEEGDIDAYETGPVILSDGDTDGGMLYGYEEYPYPIAVPVEAH